MREGIVLDQKYRIVSKLGEGGFGEVYLAKDLLLRGRYVAIKSLKGVDRNRENKLVREMEFLSALDHEHIVRFYHHFRDNDSLFLVMEYCRGGSLRDVMAEKGPLAIQETVNWVMEICRTLQAVHDKGIVHHDIKPGNILFTKQGIVKIGDFGVANTTIGTIVYMAPELLVLEDEVSRQDGRVDVYALGLTLLEALTGNVPFGGMPHDEGLQAKVRLDFVPESLPLWIREVLLKALNPKPELRFQRMQEFYEALESRHVPYVFSRKRIRAQQIAAKVGWHLERRKWLKAAKLCEQALFEDPGCLVALVAAGRCELLLRRVETASSHLERAVRINPRLNIQKELGWAYIEKGRYPEAISMLNDHLQRNAVDYEAYSLLAKAFYLTGRYEACADLIRTILQDYRENKCFENNLLLCELLLGNPCDKLVEKADTRNPFLQYNWSVFTEEQASWDENGPITLKSKLLFQEFRFGDFGKCKANVIVLENHERQQFHFEKPIISLGRGNGNDFVMRDRSVSRRHCILVNYAEDVWLYDLGSTLGTLLDGRPFGPSVFLEGRGRIGVGRSTLTVISMKGLLI